eukprot:gb/GECG01010452.1/.p1 GENE.gb/GECG01010452.1/~~gb/GECG01010452.1/.p1  ORF type:complete len:925 (+),score=163.27 gb/GECG01010452.1/:1-2775(+)
MFTKPHDVNVRSRSLLKNKDIRQLRQNVSLQLPGVRADGQRKADTGDEENTGAVAETGGGGEAAAAAAMGSASSEQVVSDVSQLLAGKGGGLECIKMQSNVLLYAFKPAKKSPEGVPSGVPLLIDTDAKSKKGGSLYPTAFTLWTLPDTLPHVVVVPAASRYIIEGADLMAPGITVAPSEFFSSEERSESGDSSRKWGLKNVFAGPCYTIHDKADFMRGEKIAIRSMGNSIPFAVGYTLMNSEELRDSGKKGRFAKITQCYRDQLWEWGVNESKGETAGIPNDGFRQHEVSPSTEAKEIVASIERVASLAMSGMDEEEEETQSNEGRHATLEEEIDFVLKEARRCKIALWELCIEAGVNPKWLYQVLLREDAEVVDNNVADGTAGGSTAAEDSSNPVERKAMDQRSEASVDMDPTDLVWRTLLQAVRLSIKESSLPMRASEVWAQHILPSRPVGTTIEIKKSSFKKVSNLLREAARERIVKLAEFEGDVSSEEVQAVMERNPSKGDVESLSDSGVLWIVGVDKKHPQVRTHRKWQKTAGDVAREEDAQQPEDTQSPKGALLSSSKIPVVMEVSRPPKELVEPMKETLLHEIRTADESGNSLPSDITLDDCHIIGGITDEEEDNEDAIWRNTVPMPFGIYVNGLAGNRRDMEKSVREGADLSVIADEIWKRGGHIKDGLVRCRIRRDVDLRTVSEAVQGILLRNQDITFILSHYIKHNDLQHKSEKSKVYLDETLMGLAGKDAQERTSGSQERESAPEMTENNFPSLSIRAQPQAAPTTTTRAATLNKQIEKSKLVHAVTSKCSPFHIRVFENRDIVVQRGKPPKIELYSGKVPNRQNKKSTLIKNVEDWGVNPNLLSRNVQREFAARATVEDIPGSSGKQEVMLQGDFLKEVNEYIIKTLEIPKKYVEVSNSTVNRGGKAKGRN